MSDSFQFDFNKTLALVKGSLLDHEATAQQFRQEDPAWMQTLITLTLPVIVTAVVLGAILSWVFGSMSIFTLAGGVGLFLRMLVWIVLALFIFAFVTAFLAGTFGGTNNFNRAFALASLVSVVSYTGLVLGALPWVGWFLWIALGIYALVLFYRDVPVFLDVPQEKRVVHIIATIVVVVVVNFLVSMLMGRGMTSDRMEAMERMGATSTEQAPAIASRLLGDNYEQMSTALQDTYDPPDDGEVSRSQVRAMIGFLEQARGWQKDIAKNLEAVSEKEDAGIGDVLAGFQGVADLQTAEMKAVKDGGGNWAEHQWVKRQLAMARSLHDRGEDGGHNYEMYEQHEDELKELMAFRY